LSFLSAAKRASDRTAIEEGLMINETVELSYEEPQAGRSGYLGVYRPSDNTISVYMKNRRYITHRQAKQATAYHEYLHANVRETKNLIQGYAEGGAQNRARWQREDSGYLESVRRGGAALKRIEDTPTRNEIINYYPQFQYAEESWIREKEKGPEDGPRDDSNLIDIGMHPGTGENDFMDRTWERAMIELDPTIERIVDEGLNNAFGFE